MSTSKVLCLFSTYFYSHLRIFTYQLDPSGEEKMKILLIFIITFISVSKRATASLSNLNMEEWQTFKMKHSKTYGNEEEEIFRMQVYLNNSRLINEHNKFHAEGKVSFQLGMNQFGDLLHHEFEQMMLMKPQTKNDPLEYTSCQLRTFIPSKKLSDKWDWRDEEGVVTPVRNQGQCGSCWAFSAVGALEGEHYLRTQESVYLSEQNLVDCAKNKNFGCKGGMPHRAFEYVIRQGGIDTQESYPYIAKDRDVCVYNKSNSGDTISACGILPPEDELQLKIAIEEVGPISVAINANPIEFRFYKSGVFYSSYCANNPRAPMTHAILAIGFGTEGKHDYWLIKNSWDTTWGEEGFAKIARNAGSHCHIASYASYPLFSKD